jgi:pyrimidine operon attenuation protein/uracil phosphoribosyltransferase
MSTALDPAAMSAAIDRLADQIFSAANGQAVDRGAQARFGVLDISLYRDDYEHLSSNPTLQSSSIDFPVDGSHVILVDDVIFTGRTIRAALDALFDYGRPSKVDLAVLIDRGHREIPVEPRFVGKHLETDRMDRVDVSLEKIDGKDAVEIITQ